MQFIELLKEVPDVVWSAVIASVITLAGVMLSNWSNTQRLMRQLAHDAHEKEKERSSAMRRDVYLKATEEMAKVGSYFGSRSEEHTSELQSLMRISYAVFCLKKTTPHNTSRN